MQLALASAWDISWLDSGSGLVLGFWDLVRVLGNKEGGIGGKRRNRAGHIFAQGGLGIGLWKREESGISVGINQLYGFLGLGEIRHRASKA